MVSQFFLRGYVRHYIEHIILLNIIHTLTGDIHLGKRH